MQRKCQKKKTNLECFFFFGILIYYDKAKAVHSIKAENQEQVSKPKKPPLTNKAH